MAHFAEIDSNNVVLRVIVVNNECLKNEHGYEDENIGKAFCTNLLGGNWIQTSYNGSFRKNYAAIGYMYDEERDAFIPPKPFPSWVFEELTCTWTAPTPYPDEDKLRYCWDEDTLQWVEMENLNVIK